MPYLIKEINQINEVLELNVNNGKRRSNATKRSGHSAGAFRGVPTIERALAMEWLHY